MKQVEAREQALTALYAADTLDADDIDTSEMSARAATLAESTWSNRETIDRAIVASASHWRIERMAVVDRNILRIGTYELKYMGIPIGIVIDEAVELAKKFSTAKSPAFINGVLSAVATTDLPERPEQTSERPEAQADKRAREQSNEEASTGLDMTESNRPDVVPSDQTTDL